MKAKATQEAGLSVQNGAKLGDPQTKQLGIKADEVAPDASEIRLLMRKGGGGLCHVTLPRGHHHAQERAQGSDQHVPFAAFDFLVRNVNAEAVVGRTHRLAVQSSRRGLGLAPDFSTDYPAQELLKPRPETLLAPRPKTAVNGLPGPKFLGQQPPVGTGPHRVKQPVHNFGATTELLGSGQHLLDQFPLLVGQVRRINTTFFHPDTVATHPGLELCRVLLKRALRDTAKPGASWVTGKKKSRCSPGLPLQFQPAPIFNFVTQVKSHSASFASPCRLGLVHRRRFMSRNTGPLRRQTDEHR